jgi:hypothetical protein
MSRFDFRPPRLGVLLCLALIMGLATVAAASNGMPAPGSISSSGGHFFTKLFQLPVADFEQDDPRWAREYLGPTTDTLGDQGCTITSVVMVLNYYGIKSDPSVLNRFLSTHDGYDSEGLLDFDRIEEYARHRIQLAYEGLPSYEAIDRYLLAGHPVILQLTLFDGGRHFVVVMGKKGFDYLVRDPAADPETSIVLLKNLSSRIDQQFVYLKAAR